MTSSLHTSHYENNMCNGFAEIDRRLDVRPSFVVMFDYSPREILMYNCKHT